jgi:hypothetical protein
MVEDKYIRLIFKHKIKAFLHQPASTAQMSQTWSNLSFSLVSLQRLPWPNMPGEKKNLFKGKNKYVLHSTTLSTSYGWMNWNGNEPGEKP